jgi:ABC-type transport system involved in multi-copper enzyme maturation permease subunit
MVNKVANYCSECGAKVEDLAIFCVSCGQKIEVRNNSVEKSKINLSNEVKIEGNSGKINKNWISAWLLIPSVLAPFREFQMISAAIAFWLISNEWEKYSSNLLFVNQRDEVNNYLTKQAVVFAIHLLYFIVAAYYYFFEFDYMF